MLPPPRSITASTGGDFSPLLELTTLSVSQVLISAALPVRLAITSPGSAGTRCPPVRAKASRMNWGTKGKQTGAVPSARFERRYGAGQRPGVKGTQHQDRCHRINDR